MALVGSAEYLVEATGVQESAQSLQVFAENVNISMENASAATEAASASAGKSVIAYAALGAAIGVVFVDFIRASGVMSTLSSAFGAVIGAIADTILIAFVPQLLRLLGVFQDLQPEVEALTEDFEDLDPVIQDMVIGFGALAIGLGLIAAGVHPIGALILAMAGLFFGLVALQTALDNAGISFGTLLGFLEDVRQGIQDLFIGTLQARLSEAQGHLDDFVTFWQERFGEINEGLAGFAHEAQVAFGQVAGFFIQFGIDMALGAAGIVGGLQDAWGGLAGWFGDLWRNIEIATSVAWATIANTFRSAWDGIVGFFQGFINALIGPLETFVNTFIDGINLLIAGLNAISFGVAAIPAIPHLDLGDGGGQVAPPPEGGEALGNIFSAPTVALIGEAGAEAVVPLTRPIPPFVLAPVLQAALAQAPPDLVTALSPVAAEATSLELGGEVLRTGAAIVHRGEQFLGAEGRASGGLTLKMTNYFSFAGGARGGADVRADLDESMDRAAERLMTKLRRRG
ncbi:MAG: hypothetical protein V3U45_05925 [bacterium]